MKVFPPFVRPYYNNPLLVERAKGTAIWDQSGRQYLDCYAGVATLALGHCHNAVDSAVRAQMQKHGHLSGIYSYAAGRDYAQRLVTACGEPLEEVFFVNSGSEAVDLALSLARVTAKQMTVIALSEGYHGGSYLTKTATGLETWHFDCERAPHIRYVATPSSEKCQSRQRCARATCHCLADLEAAFQSVVSTGGRPIFLMEPILGVGGIIVLPADYIAGLKQLRDTYGALLVVDEVQTGFGRCGQRLFAYQRLDLQPDLVAMGKGIANGYPLGAVAMTNAISQHNKDLLHFNTFGGHPISVAAASVTLEHVAKPSLLERVDENGNFFMAELERLLSPSDELVEVRGQGYMIGIELATGTVAQTCMEQCFEAGLLVGIGGRGKNVLRLEPALIFSKDECRQSATMLADTLRHSS